MMPLIRQVSTLGADVITGTNFEIPDAALTLTRTASLNIFAVGTDITWQTKVRGQGITWATTDITIPTEAYYAFTMRLATTTTVTMQFRFTLNGVQLAGNWAFTQAATYHSATTTRYFATGDVVRITLVPSVNTTMNQAAEGSSLESPFLHITQISRQALT